MLRLVEPVSPSNSMLTEVIEAVGEVHQEALWKLERGGRDLRKWEVMHKPVRENEEVKAVPNSGLDLHNSGMTLSWVKCPQ